MLLDRSHAALSQALLTALWQVSCFSMCLHKKEGVRRDFRGLETSSAEVPLLSLSLVLVNVSNLANGFQNKISPLSYCTVIRSSFSDMPRFGCAESEESLKAQINVARSQFLGSMTKRFRDV